MSSLIFLGRAAGQDDGRKVIDVRIEGRRVVEPKRAIQVREGDLVELRWLSDEAVELHLHGYDVELRVPPGKSTAMVFRARATGRFPVTSHGWGSNDHGHGHSHAALTYLEVRPR